MISDAGRRQIANQLGLPMDADAKTILATLDTRLHELAYPAAPAAAPAAPSPYGEAPDAVSWGVATGRLNPARAQFWDAQMREERARTGSSAGIEETIRGLSIVYDTAAPRGLGASESETPLLDQLDEDLFGPPEDVRSRRMDLAAEAQLAEQIAQERAEAAAPGLTEDEERGLFGDPQ